MKENVSGCFFLNTYSVYTEENRDIFYIGLRYLTVSLWHGNFVTACS